MRIVRNEENFYCEQGIVSVGTFDGVHKAHQEIFRIMQEVQGQKGGTTCIVTFDPHPQEVLHTRPNEVKLLTTIDERLALIESCGIDVAVVLKFSKEFSLTPPEQFIEELLVRRLHASEIVVGHDHGFGKGRAGDLELLRAMGARFHFSVRPVQALMLNGAPVSSSRIRTALESGDIQDANDQLGHSYSMEGIVVRGDGRGAGIGFPTANISLNSPRKLFPGNGVYAVRVHRGGAEFPGVMNIGVRPTVAENAVQSLEVHILDFHEMIYGETIAVEFIRHIRGEMKFDSVESLARQIERDIELTRQFMSV